MDKFLKIKCNKLEYKEMIFIESKFYKMETPIPILWNHKGFYSWIPMEIVKNELDRLKHNEKICPGLAIPEITFTWQQTFPLRQDVGKILEEMGND